MDTVLFGFSQTTRKALLGSLASIAREFDEAPKDMLCVFARDTSETDAVQWLTFRATPWARGEAMAAGFFIDGFCFAKRDFVVWQFSDAKLEAVTRYKAGKLDLSLRSDGAEVLVCYGKVPAKVPRTGDLEAFALAALGWTGPVPRSSFAAKSARVPLRRGGKVVAKPSIENGGAALPRVAVVSAPDEIGFAYWRDRATERFEVVRAAPTPAPGAKRVLQGHSGNADALRDLSNVDVIRGLIKLDYDERFPEYASDLPEVDLAAVREWKLGSLMVCSPRTKRVIATHLKRACDIHISGGASVELPALRALRDGTFDLRRGVPTLELPELREVKTLLLIVPDAPFCVRAPKLSKGKLTLCSLLGDHIKSSTLELPLLPQANIEVEPPKLAAKVFARLRK